MKIRSLLIALFLLAGVPGLAASQGSSTPLESPAGLALFYSNDVRGELEPCG